jgi:hypothetical protein
MIGAIMWYFMANRVTADGPQLEDFHAPTAPFNLVAQPASESQHHAPTHNSFNGNSFLAIAAGNYSQRLKEIIASCLQWDVDDRPTMTMLCQGVEDLITANAGGIWQLSTTRSHLRGGLFSHLLSKCAQYHCVRQTLYHTTPRSMQITRFTQACRFVKHGNYTTSDAPYSQSYESSSRPYTAPSTSNKTDVHVSYLPHTLAHNPVPIIARLT